MPRLTTVHFAQFATPLGAFRKCVVQHADETRWWVQIFGGHGPCSNVGFFVCCFSQPSVVPYLTMSEGASRMVDTVREKVV